MHTLIYLLQDQSRQHKAEIFRELEVRQSIPFPAFSKNKKIREKTIGKSFFRIK